MYHLALIPRALRWFFAVIVGVGGFSVAWWATETVLGIDRSTAVSVAAVIGLLHPKPVTVAGQTRMATVPGRATLPTVSYTGKQIAVGNNDQTVVLYDVSNPGCPTRGASLSAPANAGQLSFSPSRNLIAVSSYIGGKGTVTLYDTTNINSPRKAGSFDGGNSVFNSNGRLMAHGALGNVTAIVDVSNPAGPARVGTASGSGGVVFSPARDLLATTSLDGNGYGTVVNLFSVANPAAPARVGTLTFGDMVADLAFHPKRSTLATVSSGTLTLWAVANPAGPSKIAQIPGEAGGVAFQPQGGFVVTGGTNMSLYTIA